MAPSTCALNGGPISGLAQDAAEVEDLDRVAHGDGGRDDPGVTAQRAAAAEGPRQDIAGAQRHHPARQVLHRVVGGLVVQDLHREHVPLGGDDVVTDDHLGGEVGVLGGRRDPVQPDPGGGDHGQYLV
jgi:hypothetical protein